MIELTNEYVILVDEFEYTLAKKTGTVYKRTGKPKYTVVSHHSTVSGALKRFRVELIRLNLKDAVRGVDEAIHAIEESNAKVDRLIGILASMEDDRK